ncbi:amino acid adenylation domain-containing protein [Lentzea sp. NEAU-D13]|uniref:Amino acid adenylation domain-containing protein n=1 Tax=Lentzea alba TaxID=2714351 RepID=A0A7C9W4D0_9PSEU|nr:non-ribosomal peptide synthetase [Lentzea alba]NGY63159.1 amino acid adenylation domain-containing protein [Lentzea alba]
MLRFPASPGQERLWFLGQIAPASTAAYTLALRIELDGVLNVVALQSALNAVVTRHEVLRTGLHGADDGVVQQVSPGLTVALRLIDVSREARPLLEADRVSAQEVRRGWDLTQPPLMRAVLVRTAQEQHVLVMSVHHAVCDGLSLLLLLEEIFDGYQRITDGRQLRRDPDELQFADYVLWQRDQDRTELRAQWAQRLRGAPMVLELPTDARRPPRQSFTGARHDVVIDADLADRVRVYAARHGVSASSVVLTAFLVVLNRCSGADDLLVGLPVANRDQPELAGVIGYLANLCVFRGDLRQPATLGELVGRVHADLVETVKHSGLPLGELMDAVAPPRLVDRNPLFQVMFGFQQDVRRSLRLPGLDVRMRELHNGTAKVDLSLFLFEERAGAITGFLEYSTPAFEAAGARQIATMLVQVLRFTLDAPGLDVSTFELSSSGLLPLPGDGGPAPADQHPVATRIKHLAARTPDAPAVLDDTGTALDYATLDARATAAAALLQRNGVQPGDHVVVLLERTVAAVVAALACWQAGAVFVPLDPSGPAERHADVVDRVRPALTIGVDLSAAELLAAEPASPVTVLRGADSVAYLMFTSGSTGRPKGVGVTHRNLAVFLSALTDLVGLRPGDRLLALTTFAFDISLLELFGPLAVGATTVIAGEEVQRDPLVLAARLDDSITIAQATPVTWRLALDAGWRPRRSLRVLCGGEAMPSDLADVLSTEDNRVWNLYGPTETTIWSCAAEVTAGRPVTIGRPIAGTSVAVLDRNLVPVPVGTVGELVIGGAGVSTGYLGDAATTARRFLPDPDRPGERMYRTGDVVRWRTDGSLEYIGRCDEQVKVRGHRIELGEVESVLRRAEGVRDAAAVVLGDGPTARIAAYLVAESTVDGSWAGAVRRLASASLPAGAVPAEYHVVDEIPLTPNRKVDRRALALVNSSLAEPGDHVPPRTAVEREIAEICAKLLGRADVGVTDNIFLIGGHSLLVAQLVLRVEQELGVRVPIVEIFVEPTVARIAATVAQLRGDRSQAGLVDDEPGWQFEAIDVTQS